MASATDLLLLHFDGAGWSEVPLPFSLAGGLAAVNAVTGTGNDDVWLGTGSDPFAMTDLVGGIYRRRP